MLRLRWAFLWPHRESTKPVGSTLTLKQWMVVNDGLYYSRFVIELLHC